MQLVPSAEDEAARGFRAAGVLSRQTRSRVENFILHLSTYASHPILPEVGYLPLNLNPTAWLGGGWVSQRSRRILSFFKERHEQSYFSRPLPCSPRWAWPPARPSQATPPPTLPAAPQGQVVYGLTSGGQLARFGADNAAASLTTTTITGLGSGETLADLDFNTNGGLLTGLTTNGKLYTINVSSGAATFTVAAAAPGVGTPQVTDFNPAAQRLRVLSAGDMNYRLTPATTAATAGTVTSDGTLTFALTDANIGKNPNLVAAAYTNSFKDFKPDASATTLYSVDADLDILVKHTSADVPAPAGNFSVLNTVGPLGIDATGNTGFDISGLDQAYLSVSSAASTTLYTLNLTTGAATLKTTIPGLTLRSVAAALPTK